MKPGRIVKVYVRRSETDGRHRRGDLGLERPAVRGRLIGVVQQADAGQIEPTCRTGQFQPSPGPVMGRSMAHPKSRRQHRAVQSGDRLDRPSDHGDHELVAARGDASTWHGRCRSSDPVSPVTGRSRSAARRRVRHPHRVVVSTRGSPTPAGNASWTTGRCRSTRKTWPCSSRRPSRRPREGDVRRSRSGARRTGSKLDRSSPDRSGRPGPPSRTTAPRRRSHASRPRHPGSAPRRPRSQDRSGRSRAHRRAREPDEPAAHGHVCGRVRVSGIRAEREGRDDAGSADRPAGCAGPAPGR